MQQKHGLYLLVASNTCAASSLYDNEGSSVSASDLHQDYNNPLYCFAPRFEEQNSPRNASEIPDVLTTSEHYLLCSDRTIDVINSVRANISETIKVDVISRVYGKIAKYNIVWYPYLFGARREMKIIDNVNSKSRTCMGSDGYICYIGIDKLYLNNRELPLYDLFICEAGLWLSTNKFRQACKNNKISGLKFSWVSTYK